tara:strand:- start:4798 stop:5193 length:396 start_codon:yes stop_codon:yes gene_type:complete
MTIAANTSIKLNIHAPKKDAVVGTVDPLTGADEVAIWAAANVNPNLTQSIVGTFRVLRRYALTNLDNLTAGAPTLLFVPFGGTEAQVQVTGSPTADDCLLEIGDNIVNKGQSHFLDRTYKRLEERWLEESK